MPRSVGNWIIRLLWEQEKVGSTPTSPNMILPEAIEKGYSMAEVCRLMGWGLSSRNNEKIKKFMRENGLQDETVFSNRYEPNKERRKYPRNL